MRQNRNKKYKDVASSICLKNLKFKNILLLEMRLSHIPYNNLTANFKINKKKHPTTSAIFSLCVSILMSQSSPIFVHAYKTKN